MATWGGIPTTIYTTTTPGTVIGPRGIYLHSTCLVLIKAESGVLPLIEDVFKSVHPYRANNSSIEIDTGDTSEYIFSVKEYVVTIVT